MVVFFFFFFFFCFDFFFLALYPLGMIVFLMGTGLMVWLGLVWLLCICLLFTYYIL